MNIPNYIVSNANLDTQSFQDRCAAILDSLIIITESPLFAAWSQDGERAALSSAGFKIGILLSGKPSDSNNAVFNKKLQDIFTKEPIPNFMRKLKALPKDQDSIFNRPTSLDNYRYKELLAAIATIEKVTGLEFETTSSRVGFDSQRRGPFRDR